MSETRTIRLTAAQWHEVEGALAAYGANAGLKMLQFEEESAWFLFFKKKHEDALAALTKIRAAKGAK